MSYPRVTLLLDAQQEETLRGLLFILKHDHQIKAMSQGELDVVTDILQQLEVDE
jgi:hypothetical protein